MTHEGAKERNAKAEAHLRRAGYSTETPKAPEPAYPNTRSHNSEARDKDYHDNFERFRRTDDMAAPPTRGLGDDPSETASRHRK